MRRAALLWLICAVAVAGLGARPAFAQDSPPPQIRFLAIPPYDDNPVPRKSSAVRGAAAAPSLPMWDFTTTASRDGNSYSGTMIGRSPFFHGARSTNIDTVLVPLKMTIQAVNGFSKVFDPTQPISSSTCFPVVPNDTASAVSLTQESPLLAPLVPQAQPPTFLMNGVDEGAVQYIDAYQRANFQSLIAATGDRYHTALNLTKVASAFPLSIISTAQLPAGAVVQGQCGFIGVVDQQTFVLRIRNSVLPALTAQGVISSKVLPLFLLSNVVLTSNDFPNQQTPLAPGNCCVLGYHSGKGTPPNVQLFAVADFDSSGIFTADSSSLDVYFLSHEIAELVDDPLVTPSGVPQWKHGQVVTCQTNLEVADPLEGNQFPAVTMPNSVAYHLSEFAYFSWFFGGPSIAAGGAFSNHDTLTADAGLDCLQ